MNVAIKPIIITLLITGLSLASLPVLASTADDIKGNIDDQLEPVKDIYDPAGHVEEDTLFVTIAKFIKLVLQFLGIVFLILIIYAGFLWLTSAGNEEQINKAKGIIVASIIGVVIILAAYIIVSFVINSALQATGIDND